jgi:predicted Co/Zn/Cd cation transporter (cation efflux family)
MMLRGINISAAVIVLICFFLPWVQISCTGTGDAASGMNLAQDGQTLLWLVPLLMFAVITVGLLRAWKETPKVAAIVGVVSGAVTALLMNRERMRVANSSNLIAPHLTGWFWLALISSIVIVISAIALLFRRSTAGLSEKL